MLFQIHMNFLITACFVLLISCSAEIVKMRRSSKIHPEVKNVALSASRDDIRSNTSRSSQSDSLDDYFELQNATKSFSISPRTQANIYATLDAELNKTESEIDSNNYKKSKAKNHSEISNKEGLNSTIQRKLADWFPNGLLWTEEESEESDEEGETNTSIGDNDSSFVVDIDFEQFPEVEEDSIKNQTDNASSSKSTPSFHNILQSLHEGDRILNADYSDPESESDNDKSDLDFFGSFDRAGDENENHLSSGTNGIHDNFFGRIRSRRSASSSDHQQLDDIAELEKSETLLTSVQQEICEGVNPPSRGKDLSCYMCSSNSTDTDPQCDHQLFKYLKHSERFNLRGPCSHAAGDFCMKRVRRRFGSRITERGCVKGPVEVGVGDGKEILEDKDACFSYEKDGFHTTSCFCKSSLCNHAPIPPRVKGGDPFFVIAVVGLLYAVAFSFSNSQT